MSCLTDFIAATGAAVDFPAPNMPRPGEPKLPGALSILRLANVFGEPLRSWIFSALMFTVLLLYADLGISSGELVALGTGELLPEDDGFFRSNCSTAEVVLVVRPVDLVNRSFLKSMRLVFGVPIRSEHVRGISTESFAQLWRPLGCCCCSNIVRGVDRPELLGLFPCERMPSLNFNLFRSSSLNFGFGDPVAMRLTPIEDSPVGVDVNKDALLLSIMFRGLIGEIGSVIDSLATDEFKEAGVACDRKKVENPEAGVRGVLVNLFGVEYKSSTFDKCLGVVVVEVVVGLFFNCNVQ